VVLKVIMAAEQVQETMQHLAAEVEVELEYLLQDQEAAEAQEE
tara:strand:- start:465 stop:593 length:129 start_codon:yes stop_codon:yes gene_type:complete